LNDNACLRIIKTKYADAQEKKRLESGKSLKITLVYNQSMLADILNNEDHFNDFKMCRYTMTYENMPQEFFARFVKEECLDY